MTASGYKPKFDRAGFTSGAGRTADAGMSAIFKAGDKDDRTVWHGQSGALMDG